MSVRDERSGTEAVDRFEQRVVWRMSRGLYLAVAGVSSLVLVGGAAVLLWGMSPTFRGSDPPAPPEPTPPTVTLEEVMRTLDAPPEGVPDGEAPTYEAAALDAEDDGDAAYNRRFQELAAKLRMLFDDARYPWLSEQSVVCVSQGYYGCYDYERRTTRVGAVEMVNGRLKKMSSAPPEQRLALLQGLVDVASAVGRTTEPVARDELRFVAVGAVLDMVGAADEVRGEDVTALVQALSLPGPTPEAPRVDVAPEEARDLFDALLAIRKSGSDPALLRAWLGSVHGLRPLFTGDSEGKPNRVDGLAACWEALQGTLPSLVDQRIEGLRALATAAPGPRRPEIIRAWGDLVRARSMEAQSAYEMALAEREAAIAALDAEKAATDATKDELRGPALMALGGSVLLVATVGLLLALLAVERNTRALRELMAGMEGRRADRDVASPERAVVTEAAPAPAAEA